jgi:simple sugar transport system permease protein
MQQNSDLNGQALLLIALLISGAVGLIYSVFHAYASINMKADQVISGTALNMFAPAFAIFTARMVQNVQQITFSNQFRIAEVPVLGSIRLSETCFSKCLYYNLYRNFDSSDRSFGIV